MLLLTPLNLLFIPVGAGAVGVGFLLKRRQQRLAEIGALPDMTRSATGDSEELEMSFTVPMAVVVSREMTYVIDKNTPRGAAFRAEIQQLRNALYYDLGVMVPFCYVGGDAPLPANEYYIAVKEVPVGRGSLRPGCVYVNDSAENIKVFGIEGENVTNPADLRPGSWIPVEQKEIANAAGLKIWEPSDVIILHLSRIMRKHAHEFLGIQEAQGYLDFIARGMPKLVESVIDKVITIHQFTDVLQRFVQEGISIRDTKTILDALSEWGRIEKDPVLLDRTYPRFDAPLYFVSLCERQRHAVRLSARPGNRRRDSRRDSADFDRLVSVARSDDRARHSRCDSPRNRRSAADRATARYRDRYGTSAICPQNGRDRISESGGFVISGINARTEHSTDRQNLDARAGNGSFRQF